jgi:DNA-directed RNA polymerase specialized sigma subunit
MKTIKYQMADGHYEDVEVTDEFAAAYAEFEKQEYRREKREKRARQRHERSFEVLVESGWDKIDPINRDPLELLIEKEDANPDLPLFTGLTDYQRRVAVKYFVEHKTHKQIAAEEGVSQQAITKLIHKIQNKVISTFE